MPTLARQVRMPDSHRTQADLSSATWSKITTAPPHDRRAASMRWWSSSPGIMAVASRHACQPFASSAAVSGATSAEAILRSRQRATTSGAAVAAGSSPGSIRL